METTQSPVALVNNVTPLHSANELLVDKIRHSLRQNLQSQMRSLCTDFFDEVDDSLFVSGQQGQFSGDSVYLKSMREIRAKQSFFEETLLSEVFDNIRELDSAPELSSLERQLGESDAVYEKVEIELALKAMSRKANKLYRPFLKQIDSICKNFGRGDGKQVIAADFLIESTLIAFTKAHHVFALNLDIRLVFIKLFEQHFLLQMEEVFLNTISILKNIDNEALVAEQYSPGYVKPAESPRATVSLVQLHKEEGEPAQLPIHKSNTVEAAVERMVARACGKGGLPEFAENMIRNQWRAVMFLIGLNRGITSVEWSEAKHLSALLVECLKKPESVSRAEVRSMFEQIRQGFSLVRIDEEIQDKFFAEFSDFLSLEPEALVRGVSHSSVRVERDLRLESTLSPSGEDILNSDDLDEIANMLGGSLQAMNKTVIEKKLTDFMPKIENLKDNSPIEYLVSGSYQTFTIAKDRTSPELFEIRSRDSKIRIGRSKLGLALSLQNGELRFPPQPKVKPLIAPTILNSALPHS